MDQMRERLAWVIDTALTGHLLGNNPGLHYRRAADAVLAAVEPDIRADERRRVREERDAEVIEFARQLAQWGRIDACEVAEGLLMALDIGPVELPCQCGKGIRIAPEGGDRAPREE